MIRILFIDDDESSIVDARQQIADELESPEFAICDFDPAPGKIQGFQPDFVILDLAGLRQGIRYEGFDVREYIWEHRFCPIVVYSAYIEDYEDAYDEHPLVKTVRKGSGSPERVLDAVKELLPVTEALRTTQEQVNRRFWETMKVIAPIALETVDPADVIDVIIRTGRRRVAAMMDVPGRDESQLASWEQYLYPPVSQDPELGDILRIAGGAVGEPGSFRVVLTPSCDMVSSDGRHPKVDDVLVAKCCSINEALQMINMTGNGNDRHVDRLTTAVLSQGFYQCVIMLPALAGAIPTMAANLKALELVPIDRIGPGSTYERVASVDSPFRETVAWAYLQIACRPGLPERDVQAWARQIVQAM